MNIDELNELADIRHGRVGDIRKNRSYKKNHQSEGNNLKKHFELMQKYIKEGMDKEAASKKAYKELTGDSKTGDAGTGTKGKSLAELKKDLQTARIIGEKDWENKIIVAIATIEQDKYPGKDAKSKGSFFTVRQIGRKTNLGEYSTLEEAEAKVRYYHEVQKEIGGSEKYEAVTVKWGDILAGKTGDSVLSHIMVGPLGTKLLNMRKEKTGDFVLTAIMLAAAGKILIDKYKAAKAKGEDTTEIEAQIRKASKQGDAGIKNYNGWSVAELKKELAEVKKTSSTFQREIINTIKYHIKKAKGGDAMTLADAIINGTAKQYRDAGEVEKFDRMKAAAQAEKDPEKKKKLIAIAQDYLNNTIGYEGKWDDAAKTEECTGCGKKFTPRPDQEDNMGFWCEECGGKKTKDACTGTKEIPTNDELNEQSDARYKGKAGDADYSSMTMAELKKQLKYAGSVKKVSAIEAEIKTRKAKGATFTKGEKQGDFNPWADAKTDDYDEMTIGELTIELRKAREANDTTEAELLERMIWMKKNQ